ncbi:MAG TPA: hypothetical protein VMZ31_18270 [Phycisphaerae bacterium]|nr:hypothetical protein [Phycisphaerae bacterium]
MLSRRLPSGSAAALGVLLAAYLVLAGWLAWHNRDQINTDGVSYIMVARHYADGDWRLAVNGYWGPLLSWLLVPACRAGWDPLHAARLILVLVGGGLVTGVWYLCRRFDLVGVWRWATTAIAALMVAVYSTQLVTPDLMVAALLLGYLLLVTSDGLLARRLWALSCGLVGGLLYWTKAYGLPFFAVHFTVMVVLHALAGPRRAGWKTALSAWACGVAGCAVLAVPWIVALSTRYGYPTFSNSGRIAHSLIGPGKSCRQQPCDEGLWSPPEGRMAMWEDPSDLPYVFWSPLQSWAHLRCQVWNMRVGATVIAEVLLKRDTFCLRLAALGLLPVLIWPVRRRSGDSLRYLWLTATIGIYVAGYLMVCNLDSRFYWPVTILLMMLVMHLLLRLGGALASQSDSIWSCRARSAVMIGVAVVSLAVPVGKEIVSELRSARPGAGIRRTAAVLREAGCVGPLASTEYESGLHVAYHLDASYLGKPVASSVDVLAEELARAGARSLLVWGDSPLADQVLGATFLEMADHVPAEDMEGLGRSLTVYRVKPTLAAEQGGCLQERWTLATPPEGREAY